MKKIVFAAVVIVVVSAAGYAAFYRNDADQISDSAMQTQETQPSAIQPTTTDTKPPAAVVDPAPAAVTPPAAKPTPAPAPKPTPPPTQQPGTYTMAQVAQHSSASSCWSVVNGSVYDLTSWIGQHPGGKQAILSLCGKDGSVEFGEQHGGERRPASELAEYKIGALAK